MLNKVLSNHLKPSQISKIYMGVGIVGLLAVCVFIAEITSPTKTKREEKADVSNLITNTRSRELGLDAVNQKVTYTSKELKQLQDRNERLEAEVKHLKDESKSSLVLARTVKDLQSQLTRIQRDQTESDKAMEQKIKNMVGYQESESEIKTIVSNSNVQANDTVKRLPVSTTNRIQSQTSNTKFSYGNGENQVTDNQSVNQSNVTRVTTQDARTDQLFTIIENPIDTEDDAEKIYLPKGSILTGILITGLDAPTQADAKAEPVPVLVRLKKEAILPNYARLEEVRECFALMAGYGDLSSERANLRGESITCVREDGAVIEKDFGGFAVGEDGKAGLKGTLVSRNSTVLANTMMAGFASGMASMFDVNPVPVISTSSDGKQQYQDVFSTDAVQGGAAKGASQAMDKLADYYMELADAMHPVIEIGAGRVVDMVITKGTNL